MTPDDHPGGDLTLGNAGCCVNCWDWFVNEFGPLFCVGRGMDHVVGC